MAGISEKVLARRQKDIAGFTERYRILLNDRETKYSKKLARVWKNAANSLNKELKTLYRNYGDGRGRLSDRRLQAIRNKIGGNEAIRKAIDSALQPVAKPLSDEMEKQLAYEYAKSYYSNAWGLEQAAKVRISVPLVSADQVLAVVNDPWLPDGRNYSDRLRSNTAFLADKAYSVVEEAIAKGWDINTATLKLSNVAGEGYFNSVRLLRTELTRVSAQACSSLYMKNADILDDKYWRATLDSRTAPKDAKNDGKVYALDYDTPENPGIPGERIPNHPHCRCRWSPRLSALGISTRERIARGAGDSKDAFGERIYTQARTYEEYAKERGLPSLDEQLATDDPRKYLRRGETA